jgi:hypothetical protein
MPELTIISVDGRNGAITEAERLEQELYTADMEVGMFAKPQMLS